MDSEVEAFTLEVVGAGPAYTDRPGASGACYLLRAGDSALVLDLGQGSFPRLAGLLEPSTISTVVVSHLHPDHFIDLVALRHYLRWEFKPSRRVRVIGPAGLADRVDALHAESGFSAASLDVEPLLAGVYDVGRFEMLAGRVTHTDDSYGFRVALASGGPGLVYSGDCGRAEDLDALVRQGDALLVEVSFGAGPIPPGAHHLNGPAVGDLARRTAAGRVLLTHLQMGHDEDATLDAVRERYDGPVAFVQPGDAFVIGG
ncbi:MAG: MBL fold metallo-hydrolase [Candidatus Limnocylindrales bacterium]